MSCPVGAGPNSEDTMETIGTLLILNMLITPLVLVTCFVPQAIWGWIGGDLDDGLPRDY
jgi:hypothetical protein